MASSFEESRVVRSRFVVGQAALLWLVALLSTPFVGLIVMLPTAMFALALAGFWPDFDLGIISWSFFVPLALVILLPPVVTLFADRIGPALIGAKPGDRGDAKHAKIIDAFETLGIAANKAKLTDSVDTSPIVYIADEPWINATALGLRGKRPVVLTTVSAANLEPQHLQVLAATCLAESLLGRGASRVWLAARSPALLPHTIFRLLRRYPLLLVGIFVFLAIGIGLGEGIVAAIVLSLWLVVPIFLIVGVLFRLWLWVLSRVGRLISKRSHGVADVGATALLRNPEQWRDAMELFIQLEYHTDYTYPPAEMQTMFEWLLPTKRPQLEDRYQSLLAAVPAAQFSLFEEAARTQRRSPR